MRCTKLKPADETLNGNEPGARRGRKHSIVLVLPIASSFRLREATSGEPGGYVGQAVVDSAVIARERRERS
jgi:hypothetical protein